MILKTITLILLIIIVLFLPVLLQSQELPLQQSRKTVAVVLSGGGSKGVAHIGVLKALEEKGIAIDYITGTSVGAMVGGMYAAGYSPDEILELMSSQEFSDASAGRLNKKHDFYFYKNDPTPAWITFNYSFEHILSLEKVIRENIPSNLVPPGMMDFMFMQYLSPASNLANNNFDSLFIPFRCVASDITNKRAVIMHKGNLSEAVRASMTFPFYFKPIMVDSMVLFDGGMFNNFPADVAMESFQPDIIIGSVVAANPNPPSVHDLLSQLENMLMVHSDYSLPKGATGIILHPDVPPLNVTDFSQNSVVFASGYRDVLRNMDSILSLNPGRTTEAELQEQRELFRNNYPQNKIRNIVLNTYSGAEGAFAKAFLKPIDEQITLTDLQNNYYRLLSLDKFRHIYPRLVFNKDENLYDMQLDLIKNYAFHRSFGGNLSSQSINQFFAMFAFEKLGKYPLTIYTNFFVGNIYNSGKLGIRTDFIKIRPFYLLAETSISRWNYAAETIFLLEEQKPSFIIQHEYLTDIRLVFPSGYKGKWETGLFHTYSKSRYYNTSFFSRSDKTDLTILRPLGLYVGREINTLNHNQYPTSGSFLNIRTRLMSGREEYEPGNTSFNQEKSNQLHTWWEMGLKWENFFFHHRRFRPSLISEVFLSNRPLLVNFSASRIMSKQYIPFPLAGTRYLDAFRSNHFFAGGLKGVLLLNRNWLLQAEAHFFHSFKEILPDIDHSARYHTNIGRPTFMYHAAMVFHTPLGPLSAGFSYFEKEEDPLAFVINFGYILFNRKTF